MSTLSEVIKKLDGENGEGWTWRIKEDLIKVEWRFPVFDKLLDTFKSLYPEFPCVIAGGAVRDALLGKEPKDLDIYFLGANWKVEDRDAFNKKLSAADIFYEISTSNLPWHKYERYLLQTIIWKKTQELKGVEVQFMGFPVNNIDDLLATFDWEICVFGYRDGILTTLPESLMLLEKIEKYDPKNEKYRPPRMYLCNIQFPISNLRRGFKFEARYPLKLSYQSILKLCDAALKEKRGSGYKGIKAEKEEEEK